MSKIVVRIEAKFVAVPLIITPWFRTLALNVNDLYPLLKEVSYIYYLLYVLKDPTEIKALIDSGNKVNVMILAYTLKLGIKI